MSERYYASVLIWGKITRAQADELKGLLAEDADLSEESAADEIDRALDEGRAVEAECQEASYGEMEDLERWLRAEGISFRRFSSDYGCDTFHGYVWFAPEQGLEGLHKGDDQVISVLDMYDLLETMKEMAAVTIEEAPKYLEGSSRKYELWATLSLEKGEPLTAIEFFEAYLKESTCEEPAVGILEIKEN